jgi:hypothetical protein
MAIATLKYDEFHCPKRAKYRIVVLGNHDYHTWSKEATAALLMPQLELCLLTALAVYHKCILKNCDVKQAFVQSSLPSNESYFVKPPVGCPKSDPGTYWRLLRSLYGLCHALKLWFEKLSSHLKSMGLRTSSNSPCLFIGHLIPGEPSMYVGIYIDDIIYFSLSDAFEKQFELSLSTIGNVDFMGKSPIFWVLNLLGKLALTVTFVLALLNNPLLTLYLTSWVF